MKGISQNVENINDLVIQQPLKSTKGIKTRDLSPVETRTLNCGMRALEASVSEEASKGTAELAGKAITVQPSGSLKGILETEVEKDLDAFDEAVKNHVSPERLYQMLMAMLQKMQGMLSRFDHASAVRLQQLMPDQVKNVQGTFKGNWKLIAGVLGAACAVASAFCGLSPLLANRLFMAADTATKLAKSATHIGAIGQVFKLVETTAENSNAAGRTAEQHALDVIREQAQRRWGTKHDVDSQKQSAAAAANETERSRAQAFQQQAS